MLSTISRQIARNLNVQPKKWAKPLFANWKEALLLQTRTVGHGRFYTAPAVKAADSKPSMLKRSKRLQEGLTVEQLKQKIKDEAAKKLKAAQPKKTLDKLVKLDLLENETPENIAKIWNAGHANKDCITAVIPSDVYDKLYKRSQEYPMFVVPMPREEGVEFMFLHQTFPHIDTFHRLEKSKGIVLMKGEINDDPRMLDTANAQFLAFALQQFYVTGGEDKLKLVEQFHKKPAEFDFQKLIQSVETLV
ncbi:ATP11, mitochondrial F1-ATPase assembly protein [Mucor lusitanicus]